MQPVGLGKTRIFTNYTQHPSRTMKHLVHPQLCNINLHNVTHSLISQNPREHMFVVQISFLTVTFLSLISQNLSSMQTTQEVNPHPHITPCVNICIVTFLFFFLCHLLEVGACICHSLGRPSGVDHTSVGDGKMNSNHPHIFCVLFHDVTCYTNSIIVSRALWLPHV